MNQSFAEMKDSLKRTARWYESSGIMLPENGEWGVGERILLNDGNETADHTYRAFPAWTPCGNYSVIEQRRADCNMEAAFLYLLLHEVFGEKKYYDIAHHILKFLYHRSGLLKRFGDAKAEKGVWNWSHIKWEPTVYFDDNAWMCALQLMIAGKYPELDREFDMRNWGLLLADVMCSAWLQYFPEKTAAEEAPAWLGDVKLPHWSSLVCMALSRAYREKAEEKFRQAVDRFHSWLLNTEKNFNTSEFSYVILGATESYSVFKDELSLKVAGLFTDRLLAQMDPVTGNLPAQHYEAPAGANLADTIYTLNWAVLALQNMSALDKGPQVSGAYEKILSLLLKIQDRTPEPHLYGCWRGMFDLDAGRWGGGDRFEGGANSIYSGWTNAPIPWAVANACLNRTLLNY